MIDTVLFDIGDTLLHFETLKAREFFDTATRPGYDRLIALGHRMPEYHRYLRALKRTFWRVYVWSRIIRREVRLAKAFDRCHRHMGLAIDEEHLQDAVRQCIRALRAHMTTNEHAVEVAARLHAAGLHLGLVSNTVFPGFAIDDLLESEGLLPYFSVRVYSSDVGYMKPQRAIFQLALDRLGASAARTLFVGDRLSKDIAGSARLGITSALFAPNGRSPRWRIRPNYVVRSLREIPGIVQRANQGE